MEEALREIASDEIAKQTKNGKNTTKGEYEKLEALANGIINGLLDLVAKKDKGKDI